jgi:hypothetical protein
MSRRKRHANSVSFFAFQDVITSVVGIFVLITLIMVLELAQTVSERTASRSATVTQASLDSLANMEAEVQRLRAETQSLQAVINAASSTNRFTVERQSEEQAARLSQLEQDEQQLQRKVAGLRSQLAAALEVQRRAAADTASADQQATQRLDELEQQRAGLKRYASVLETDKTLLFREQTREGRDLVLVRLEAGRIVVTDSQTGDDHQFSGSTRLQQFSTWLARLQLSDRHFLLIVKPTGVGDFKSVEELLERARAVYGYDIAPEDATFILRTQLELP